MGIKEIAEQVSERIYVEDGLLKEVTSKDVLGEPVGEVIDAIQTPGYFYVKKLVAHIPQGSNLFTSDQLATAQEEISGLLTQLREMTEYANKRNDQALDLQDQLAKAEQRVAEACALQVATEIKFHWLDADRVAKEIRSGEWRKFVK